MGELYYQIATEKIDRTKIDIEEIINNEINKPALEELSKPKKVIKKGNAFYIDNFLSLTEE